MSSYPLPSYAVSRDVAEAALCLMAMSRSGGVVDGQAVSRVPRSSVPPALRDVLHWDGDYGKASFVLVNTLLCWDMKTRFQGRKEEEESS